MRKHYTVLKLACFALFFTVFQSCTKENGINDDQLIKTPYTLYFADSLGGIYNTNTGDTNGFRMVFPKDGYAPRALCISKENVIVIRRNLQVSVDNGHHFSTNFGNVISSAYWQSMILDVPSFENRLYICTQNGKPYFSYDNGLHWGPDDRWDSSASATNISSLAQLSNGKLFAYTTTGQLYHRNSKDEFWWSTGISNAPEASSTYYLSSYNNSLILTDYTGQKGIWHSEDEGANWYRYNTSAIPAGDTLLATNAPFGRRLLVGTKRNGIYALRNNAFVPINSGMVVRNSVYAIAGKSNRLNNDVQVDYVYIATENGLYRSEDYGETWQLVFEGEQLRAAY